MTASLLHQLRARLAAAAGPVSLTALGRDLLKAPWASPEQVRRILQPLLAQIPEAVLGDDGCLRRRPAAEETGPAERLTETRFVVVDVETTGRSAPPGRMIEVACVTLERGRITETFTSLINPGEPIPPFITALTGITDAMAAAAPPFAELAADVRRRLAGAVVVAHNAPFDRRFLTAELTRADETFVWTTPTLCTVRLARRLVPGLDSYRLASVAGYFGIRNAACHRAAGDALATAELFLRLLERLGEEGVSTVEAAVALMTKGRGTNRRRLRLSNEEAHDERRAR